MQLYTNSVQDRFGNALKGAQITVRTAAGVLATLYADNGVTLATNPLTADATGEFRFYAANGRYTFTVTASGMQAEIVSAFEMQDALELQAAVTGGAAQVAADRIVTGQDKAATAADRLATAADRVITTQDKGATAADRLVTAADRAATGLDKAAALATRTAIDHRYRGALAADPATRTDGTANVVGDEVFNSTAGLLKRWNGTVWLASDLNTANLAAPGGAALIGLGLDLTYADQSLADQAMAVRAIRRGRSAPHANFNWFTADFTVAQCRGPGRASLVQDIADVFQAKFAGLMGGAVSFVHPNGSDANAGDSWRGAFLTLNKALRQTGNGTIFIWPGAYDLSDFRFTDTYGGQPKKIIAPFAGVTLRTPGDDVSVSTWTLNGDYGGMYQTCIASANKPVRVLRKDLLDKYGEPTPMPLAGSMVGLGGIHFGWVVDTAYSDTVTGNATAGSNVLTGVNNAKSATPGLSIAGPGIPAGTTITAVVPGTSITMSANATATAAAITATISGQVLYVRTEMNTNVQTVTKANLQVIYAPSGDNRTLNYSATSYWENITFLGYISNLKAAGQAVPQFWAKGCTFKYGQTHAVLNEGGYTYLQDCRAYRPTADGANYNLVNDTIAQGVEINFTTQFAGDVDTYGTGQTLNPQGAGTNKNGSSNHSGYVVRVNGLHVDGYGPNIADTATSFSWNLGVKAGYNKMAVNSIPSSPRYGILNQNNNAWIDGCEVTGNDAGLNSDGTANVRVFNSFGTKEATGGGVFTAYVPT